MGDMGDESVKGAGMGVNLLIFAAILAIGLIIFFLARNMANDGLTNVTEGLEAASNSGYSDFDQKVVVGQRVISALNSYKGKKVAVLIATQGLIDKTAPAGNTTYTPSVLTGGKADPGSGGVLIGTAVVTNHEQMFFAFAATHASIGQASAATPVSVLPTGKSGPGNSKALTLVQYNALLEGTDEKGIVAAGSRNSMISWRDDHYEFSGTFRADATTGKTEYDSIFVNTTTSGRTESIPASARFQANLLKDANGVILGIVLQQITG